MFLKADLSSQLAITDSDLARSLRTPTRGHLFMIYTSRKPLPLNASLTYSWLTRAGRVKRNNCGPWKTIVAIIDFFALDRRFSPSQV